jgi:hypothetical protein
MGRRWELKLKMEINKNDGRKKRNRRKSEEKKRTKA